MRSDLRIISIFTFLVLAALVMGFASAAPSFAIGPDTGFDSQIGYGCAAPTFDDCELGAVVYDDAAACETMDLQGQFFPNEQMELHDQVLESIKPPRPQY